MNRTQRPNFVLVCIAAVLISFSLASEVMYKLSSDSDAIQAHSDGGKSVDRQIRPRLAPATIVSQPFTGNELTPNGLAAVAFQDINPLNPDSAEDVANVNEDVVAIEALRVIERQLLPVSTGDTKTALIEQDNRFTYKTVDQPQTRNNGARLLVKHAGNTQKTSSPKAVSRNLSRKEITVSVRRSGFLSWLANNKYTAKEILKQAVAQLNLSEEELEEIVLAVASKKRQKSIAEETQGESKFDYSAKLMAFFRKLSGQSAENKIYVLKNLSPDKLGLLKQILNGHNITLRAFITG
ncbi:MAG: hypothetical protein ACI84O_000925 [Myxococcota bacterium]|jgi:hypothetical protein